MKKTLNLLLLLATAVFSIFPAGIVSADEGGHGGATNILEQQVDGYWIRLTFVNGAAAVGNNSVTVSIMDPQGQPVTNAPITIISELYPASQSGGHAGMNMTGANHNMASMGKPLQTKTVKLTAIPYSTDFEGKVEMNKNGSWMLNVIVGLDSQMKSAMFSIDLTKTGPNWYVFYGFFGLIAVIMVVGGLTKRKPVHQPLPEAAV